jgi:hypothetical protein
MAARMDPQIELCISQMRKTHPRWRARRIHAELTRKGLDARGVFDPPSPAP